MKKGFIISSISSLLLCMSIVGGATYALFTSESKVNIKATAGTIKVMAAANNFRLYSSIYDDISGTYIEDIRPEYTFANGGTVTVDSKTNLISIEKMTELDRLEFVIDIDNQSDVLVKYRTIISSLNDTGLFEKLEIKINNQLITGEIIYSPWEMIEINDDPDQVTVSIGLPLNSGVGDENQNCQIVYNVSVVQGNKNV